MRQRTLALVALLAALAIVAVFRRDRSRDVEPKAAPSPEERDAAEPVDELSYAEPARVGRAEAPAAESNGESTARNEPRFLPRAAARPAQEIPVLESPVLETADAILVFRALDETGQAVLGELSVATKVRSRRSARSSDASARTDAEGRFEVRIEAALVEGEHRELEVSEREQTLMARVDITRSFPPGRTDMGDLVLTPAPLIAEGRVIDAAGQPVVGGSVPVNAFAGRDQVAREIRSWFRGEAETGEDGAFALYGDADAARMEVDFRHERLRAMSLELPVGSRGIEIVAHGSGGVAGRVLLDPGVPVDALRVDLRPEQVAGMRASSFDSSRKKLASDGSFQLEGFLPWRYTLSVTAERDVLVEIPGIEIVSDEITRDPRLEALDLRGRLHVFTLDLVRQAQSLELGGVVSFGASGTSTPVCRQYFAESPVVIVTPLTAIDVTIRARDCRIERLYALAERTEVLLRPCINVRLVLPRGILLPAPPLSVRATLVREDERREERTFSATANRPTEPFDEHGETLCQAYEPGRYTVRWSVERRHANGASETTLDMPFEQVVLVEDRGSEQRIELVVTNRALTAALAAR